MCQFEAADAVRLGIGEGAFHVSEQLALEDAFGKRAGIDRDQRALGAGRKRVNGLRDNFLAGSVLAQDKNVGIRRRDARDRLHHALHGGRRGDEVGTILRLQQPVLSFEMLRLLQSAIEFDLGANDGDQALVVPRLLDEIASAAPHGLDGELHVGPRGHHDHRQIAVDADNLGKQRETFLPGGGIARVVQVDEHGVVVVERQRLAHQGGRAGRIDLVSLSGQQQLDGVEDVLLIVGGQHPGAFAAHSAGPAG